MTQEEKKLLLTDLCARLPYNLRIRTHYEDDIYGDIILHKISGARVNDLYKIENCKPYLRPMSNMTEEEKHDLLVTTVGIECVKYFQVLSDGSIDNTDAAHQDLYNFTMHGINFDGINTTSYLDWLNAHHFDYRGLIEKGLAIAITKENNPYENI